MDSKIITKWGAVVVSILAMVIFAGCLVAAFFMADPGLLNLAVGAAIASNAAAVQYWLGSSAGSQKKDETIAASATAAAAAATVSATEMAQRLPQ